MAENTTISCGRTREEDTAEWSLPRNRRKSLKSERSVLMVDSGDLVIACGAAGFRSHVRGIT